MRGPDEQPGSMFSYLSLEERVPQDHPLRAIRRITDRALERLLQVDVVQNLKDENVVRAGFNYSGVSKNNRLIERHDAAYGAYWRSYDFANNKERRTIDGRDYILETALRPDFGLIRAEKADELGNLSGIGSTLNFHPSMAAASNVTIAEVDEIVPAGSIAPEDVNVPREIEVIALAPSEVRVELDSSAEKTLPISARLTGKPAPPVLAALLATSEERCPPDLLRRQAAARRVWQASAAPASVGG